MGERKEPGRNEHSVAKRVAIASAGAIAAAAAVGAAKALHDKKKQVSQSPDYARKRRLRLFSAFGSTPEEQAAIARADIFKDEDILKAEMAVRIHAATVDTAASITANRLREALGDAIEDSEFESDIRILKDNALIEEPDDEDSETDTSEVRYRALPALVRAIEDGNYSILAEAQSKILLKGFDQGDTF